jgi:cell division protein FtsW
MFDTARQNRFFFLSCLVFLSLTCIISLASNSFIASEKLSTDPYFFLNREIIFLFFSIFAILLIGFIPTRLYDRFSYSIIGLNIFLLVLVFIPGIGKSVTTSYGREFNRWISFGSFQIQPSEICKITSVIFLSSILKEFKKGESILEIIKPTIVILMMLILIFMEPAFGTTIEIIILAIIYLIYFELKTSYILIFILSCLPLAFIFVQFVGYRKKRLDVWLNPFKYKFDDGHQMVMSFKSIYNTDSLGQPIQNQISHRLLPYNYTDFAFVSFLEDIGWVGVVFYFLILFYFFRFWYESNLKIQDSFRYYISNGFFTIFMIQILMNLSVVSGFIPVTGLSYPFLSYGGSYFFVSSVMLGIVYKIFKEEGIV